MDRPGLGECLRLLLPLLLNRSRDDRCWNCGALPALRAPRTGGWCLLFDSRRIVAINAGLYFLNRPVSATKVAEQLPATTSNSMHALSTSGKRASMRSTNNGCRLRQLGADLACDAV